MRRVVVLVKCAFCPNEGEEKSDTGELKFIEVKIACKGQEFALDTCAECINLSPLVDVLEEAHPVRPVKPVKKVISAIDNEGAVSFSEKEVKEYKCPECGLLCKNPQGWGAHRRSTHGVVSTRVRTKK